MPKFTKNTILSLLLSLVLMTSLLLGSFPSRVLAETAENPETPAAEDQTAEDGEQKAARLSFFDRREELDPAFFEEGLAYYKEIAGYDLRDEDMNHYIKKWTSPLRVGLDDFNAVDLRENYQAPLADLVDQLNQSGFLPEISFSPMQDGPHNVQLTINKLQSLRIHSFSGLQEASAFYVNWTNDPPYRLYSATLGVAYDQLPAEEIAPAASQKLLQALGFMSSSESHPDSIFYAKGPASTELSDLDWLILEMHYRPELKPGMDLDRAVEILENLYLGPADYDPADEEPSPAELWTEAAKEEERKAVEKDQELWQSFGLELNPEGPRETFYERRADIDPEFFERGLKLYEEVAGSGEFDHDNDGFVKKWAEPIQIFVDYEGEPNPAVLDTLDRVVMQLNSLKLLPEISYSMDENEPYNIHLLFAPLDELTFRMPDAPPGNWGFFNYWWKTGADLYEINRANVGVATDVNQEVHMIHLLQEELIQTLGLINDSYEYRDSIYCQDWGHIQAPSEIDWLLIEMHYRPEITPGMPMDQALDILRGLYLDETAGN